MIAGGTGVSPVRGVIDHFAAHPDKVKSLTFLDGFKTPMDILFRSDFDRWKKDMNLILAVDCIEIDTAQNTGLATKYIPKLKLEDAWRVAAI